MGNVYFMADLHLGHKNIHKFRECFETAEENDHVIKENYHKVVTKRDKVFFLGDVCFNKDKLNDLKSWHAERKVLVLGNHDTEGQIKMTDLIEVFDEIYSLVRYKNCWLSHAPIHPDELRGKRNVHGHCVDGDTEILTSDGWKKYYEVAIGDKLPTVGPSGKWEDDEISDIIIRESYHGDAYQFTGKGVSMLVSDRHRVVFLNKSGVMEYLEAHEAFSKKNLMIIKSAESSYDTSVNLTDDMIRLYVQMVADGDVTKADLFRIMVKKDRKVERVRSLLDSLSIDYTENKQKDSSVCFNFRRPEELEGWNIKGLDEKVFGFSKRQVGVLREEYRHSDGNRNLIFSSKKDEVDILQRLFVLNGFSAKVHDRVGHGFSKNASYQISVTESCTQNMVRVSDRVEKIVYTGVMWCVTTKNTNFFARRGGSVYLTGNCHTHIVDDPRYLNVSMENINYFPLSLDGVRERFKTALSGTEFSDY